MTFTTMKIKKRLGILSLLTGFVAIVVGCSNVADKGAIPPQGPPQKKVTDSEHAVFNQQVDILMVIDDSGSMSNHQMNLAANIKLFTAELAKTQILDYHVGVVTTSMDKQDPNAPWDPSDPWGAEVPCDNLQVGASHIRACGDGRLVRFKTKFPFIDRNTPNGLKILEDNVIVGINGSGEEHSFDPIHAALTSPMENTVNAGFLRPDAALAIIFVTDSEDQSVMTPQSLYNFLLQLKGGQADKLMAYGALVPSSVSDPTCSRDEYGVTPQKIESFISMMKGLEYNICDSDYGSKFAIIGADVAAKVGRVMYLSRPPVVDTIVVTFGSQVIPNDAETGWTYDPVRNALIFGQKVNFTAQPPGTQLEVNFTTGTY